MSVFPFIVVLFLRHYLSAFPASLLHLRFILFDRIKCRHVPYTDCPSLIEYFVIRRRASYPIPFPPFIHCSSSPLPFWTLVTLIAFPTSFRTAVPALISILGVFPVSHSVNVRSMKGSCFIYLALSIGSTCASLTGNQILPVHRNGRCV